MSVGKRHALLFIPLSRTLCLAIKKTNFQELFISIKHYLLCLYLNNEHNLFQK